MPTTQAFILATTVFPLLAIAKDFPQLDEARLVLADNSAVCYYTNYKFFSPDEESLQLRVRHTNGIQPVEITCPRPEVFEGTFSWPPGLYFDESAFSEDLASLNTTAVELDYIPEYEWERFVSDEDLKTMGEKGAQTRARLRAVCAAVREVLQDMFPSFQIFYKKEIYLSSTSSISVGYYDESAFSEEQASLNTSVVELNYTPDNDEEGMVVGDERLEAMGEKGVETSARLKAVRAAVREMLQDKFTSFEPFASSLAPTPWGISDDERETPGLSSLRCLESLTLLGLPDIGPAATVCP
ncbi:hypothetical protein FOZ63_030480 [Perkinsus olseni]|uniref:Uncharacterized protein n=1 Tax=Perkinsus olseni TaxID=32597 RepID=A0A7J6S2F5_PEROL|nr:hypothetical protein FOZ63_030480 [Perkinsus olseni]